MKKKTTKLLALLLICAMIMSIAPMAVLAEGEPAAEPQGSSAPWDGTSTKQPSGTGEENDPYLISTAAELAWVAQEVNGGRQANRYYKLTADIDLNNKPWTPIGNSSDAFSGTFYGDEHHTIKGLYIEGRADSALFGNMTSGNLKNFSVEGTVKGATDYAAGVLAHANLTDTVFIENVGSKVDASATSAVGGIVGFAEGNGTLSIKTSYNSGEVSGPDSCNVGGLVGFIKRAGLQLYVTSSYNMGKVIYKSGSTMPGGIVSEDAASKVANITNCFNAGEIVSSCGSAIIAGVTKKVPNVDGCYYLRGCYYDPNGKDVDPNIVAGDKGDGITATPFTDSLTAPDSNFTQTKDISVRVDGSNKTVTIPTFEWDKVISKVTVTFDTAKGGSYTVNGTMITKETKLTEKAPATFTLVATPDEGYKFLGWFDASGNAVDSTFVATNDMAVTPRFAYADSAWGVGAETYDSLDAAVEAAASTADKTIILRKDTTLLARDEEYVIPAGYTLLIPYSEKEVNQAKAPADGTNPGSDWSAHNDRGKSYAYRTLTMNSGAKLTVNGALSIGGYYYAPGSEERGNISGGYGCIQMNEGSSIVVNSGAKLYAWGFISGQGTVTVKNGAVAYEWFQVNDFRGGTKTGTLFFDTNTLSTGESGGDSSGEKTPHHVFMFSQYYVQNVEVAMTFEKGASEKVYTVLYMAQAGAIIGVDTVGSSINFVGENGMFKTTDGSFTKDYDENTDRMVFTSYGTAEINSIVIDLEIIRRVAKKPIDSKDFVLPITNNIVINVKSASAEKEGNITVNQDIALLPGAEINIDSGSSLTIAEGSNLYVYDSDAWKASYVNSNTHKSYVPATTQPGRVGTHPLSDAKILINGTLDAFGGVYTTVKLDSEGNIVAGEGSGANICSTGSGLFIQEGNPGTNKVTYQYENNSSFASVPVRAAYLKNADGSYYAELFSLKGGGEVRYINGQWTADFYTITWDVNGTATTVYVPEEQKPIYTGSIPSKPMTDSGDRSKAISYRFIGWRDENDDLYTNNIPVAEEDMTYTAEFKPVRAYYNIALGVKLGDGADVIPLRTTTYYNANAARKLTTPAFYKTDTANYVFDHWEVTLGGEMDATYNTHQITIRPNQGGEYSAVAVYRLADTAAAESPEVHLTETYTEIVAANDDQQDRLLMKAKYKTCATMTFTVPEGYKINDVGFVVSIKDSNKDPVYQDGNSLSSLCGSWSGKSGLFSGAYTVHINMSNYQSTNTYIKAYLKVTDAQGNASTIYSDPVSCTFNALNGK